MLKLISYHNLKDSYFWICCFFLFNFFTGGCVGKVFQDQLDDGKTLKLSRKQLRKAFTILGSQLSEVDEALIFELLGK